MNWVDKLVIEYEQGRKDLRDMSEMLGSSEMDIDDKAKINSMINDMTFSIEFMKTGTQPDMFLGIDKRGAYQLNSISNMDWFPSLDIVPERRLTDEEKEKIILELAKLSARERVCFIFSKGYLWTQEEIAEELGITQQAVNKNLKSANRKLGRL